MQNKDLVVFCFFFATHEKVAINGSRSLKKKSNEKLNQAIDEDFEKTKLLPRLK